jgi:hypothetical protein
MSARLDAAYFAQVKATRARVEAFAARAFLAGDFRDADLARFLEVVLPVVLAGQRTVSSLTDAYLAMTLSESLGRRVAPAGPLADLALRGVDPAEVYARPYRTVWTKLSEGMDLADAVAAGAARLNKMAASDLQLAKTHTARARLADVAEVTSYRRTLTGAVNCGLCSIASTQLYYKADLLPIHPGCDCGVHPNTEADPVDEAGNAALLESAHAAIEERLGVVDRGGRAPDYRKLILVRQHGELGPTLTVRGQHFDGPAAVA